MAKAADKFVESLDEKLRTRAVLKIDSSERRKWTNLPPAPDAGGVRFGDLDEKQIRAACDLMQNLLSEQGYQKMCNIMLADDQLLSGGRARSGFGTENFSIVIFGQPSATDPWACQLDGHHIGMNIAVKGSEISMSPSFIGTQPESYRIAGKSIRPLGHEIDEAYKLVGSLTDPQRKKAVLRDQRGQIATGPGNDNKVPDPQGIACSELNDNQQQILLSLISQWVNILPPEQAEQRLKQITEEMDQMNFAWNGAIKPGSAISYIIQSPSLIIEYACQDLGGNPLDHLHSMYRNPKAEYGNQLKN